MLPLSPRHNRNAGFTLIEVLVALAVVTVSIAAIGSVIAVNLKNTRAIEQRLEFRQIMRTIMAGLPDRRDLQVGSQSGEIDGYQWRIDVAPMAAGFLDPESKSPWVPFSVAIRAQSPTGRVLQVDTIRLRRRPDG